MVYLPIVWINIPPDYMYMSFAEKLKRSFVCISIPLAFIQIVIGQKLELAPGIAPSEYETANSISELDAANFIPTVDAMWDLQYTIDIENPTGKGDLVGCYFFNNEFLFTAWAHNAIYRFDQVGNFLGVSFITDSSGAILDSIRAVTSDGISLFMTDNSAQIYEINPSTDSIIGIIDGTLAGFPIRFATFDSTADGGTGGFWVGNYNTDIVLLDRSGGILNSVPASTHGLVGMYGAAVDNFSDGGPYLWVFHQGASGSAAVINQLKLPLGTQTGIERDVAAELGVAIDAAGGLFISDEIIGGQLTLAGILQADNNLAFGYELDFDSLDFDMRGVNLAVSTPYYQVPLRLVEPVSFSGLWVNQGQMEIDTARVNLEVGQGNTIYYSDTSSGQSLLPGASLSVEIGPFTPFEKGIHKVVAWGRTGTATFADQAPANDTAKTSFVISDSILARDNMQALPGGYVANVSDELPAYAITIFDFPQPAYVKGIEITLSSPQHGEITYPIMVKVIEGMPSGAPFIIGDTVILDSNQHVYYLKFPSPVAVDSNSHWGIGVYEDLGGIFLAQSENIFMPKMNFYAVNAHANPPSWIESGIPTARFIRPMIATCSIFGLSLSTTPASGSMDGAAIAVVSNAIGEVSYQWDDPALQETAIASGLSPGTYTVTAKDENGCTATDSISVANTTSKEGLLAAGIEHFQLFPNPASDILTLELTLNRPQTLKWVLYDLQARLMKEAKHTVQESLKEDIDMRYLPRGLYKFGVITEQGETYKSLFLE